MNLTINSLQHVGIPVSDLAASEQFYASLGFERVMHAPFAIEGEKGFCSMIRHGNITLELYQLPPRELTEIKTRRDGHIDHISFDVPDVEVAMDTLRSNGFNVIESSPVQLQFWKKGVRFFFITGPDGERLEFNQIL